MKRITTAFATLALLLVAAKIAPAQKNTLTPEEAASGYQLLFNGTDLSGWRSYNTVTPPSAWTVVAESTWKVMNITTGSSNVGSIMTKDSSFQNFDLKVEWAVSVGGNSGIFIRYLFRGNNWGGAYGPESQVVDITNSDGNSTLHRAGDAYDMFSNSYPSWVYNGSSTLGYRYNQFRMIVYGPHIAHYGNGRKIIEYTMGSAAYNTAYSLSKYSTYPLYKDIHPGAIYIQNHGETGIRYRNLRIKNFGINQANNPWAVNSPYLKVPGDTTQGLKDTLTFQDNIYPVSIARAGAPANGLKMVSNHFGTTVFFGKRGDYTVRVQDLAGRTSYSRSVQNAEKFLVPAAAQGNGARVVTVQSHDGSSRSAILAPIP